MTASVTRGDDGGKIVGRSIQLLADLLKGRLCAGLRTRSGSDDGKGEHVFPLIQHNHVRRGRTAVYAGIEPLFFLRPDDLRLGKPETFAEGFQPRGKLPHGGKGIIRFNLERRNGAPFFQIGVFKAVVIAEFDGVVDDCPEVFVFIEHPASGDIRHAHAGRHAE